MSSRKFAGLLISFALVFSTAAAHADAAEDLDRLLFKTREGCRFIISKGLSAIGFRPSQRSQRQVLDAISRGEALAVTKMISYGSMHTLNDQIDPIVLGSWYNYSDRQKYFPPFAAIYAYDGVAYSSQELPDGTRKVIAIPNRLAKFAIGIWGYDRNAVNMSWLDFNLKPAHPEYEPIFRSMLSGEQTSWERNRDGSFTGEIQLYSPVQGAYFKLTTKLKANSTELSLTRRPCDRGFDQWIGAARYLRGLAPADAPDPIKTLLAVEGQRVTLPAGAATIAFLQRIEALGLNFDYSWRGR